MSPAQYTAIGQTRLIDVKNIRESLFIEYLQSRPYWVQKSLVRLLGRLS